MSHVRAITGGAQRRLRSRLRIISLLQFLVPVVLAVRPHGISHTPVDNSSRSNFRYLDPFRIYS